MELNRWKERKTAANNMLAFGAFFHLHGISAQAQRTLQTGLEKLLADLDDLNEIAQLAGTDLGSDPDLLERASEIQTQWRQTVAGVLQPEDVAALDAYVASRTQEGQNPIQLGEARYVANQVAGLTFDSSPLDSDQRAQLIGVLVQHMPNYRPGDNNNMDTIDWDGVLADAKNRFPAAQVMALQALQAQVQRDVLEKQARQASLQANHR